MTRQQWCTLARDTARQYSSALDKLLDACPEAELRESPLYEKLDLIVSALEQAMAESSRS